MSTAGIADIIRQAVAIETNGELFYKEQAEKFASNIELKTLFERLAHEEEGHRSYFLSLIQSLSEKTFVHDEDTFMDSFIKRMIFDTGRFRMEMDLISSVGDALDFAIRRELDSVLYYYELKRLVDSSHYDAIDTIAQEERRHVSILTSLKEKIIKKEDV